MARHRVSAAGRSAKWRPGLLCRLAAKATPIDEPGISSFRLKLTTAVHDPVKPIDWQFAPITISAGLDPAAPSVDFLFPNVAVVDTRLVLDPPAVSEDLVDFPGVETLCPAVEALLGQADVSENLYEPLRRARVDGKVYESRSRRLAEQDEPKTKDKPKVHRDKDGLRKSYSITKSGHVTKRNLMQIWDLILPILQPPLSFDFTDLLVLPNALYAFQVDGVRFLAERDGALLGDDMGTGKTIQAIVAMRMLFQSGEITSALIVVPLTLLRNWDRELFKWAEPLSGVTVVRGTREERKEQWQQLAHVYIATYGTVRNDIDSILKHRAFDLVVVDEVQAIKNREAEQSKAVKQLPRQRAWGLSGTPIENRIDDLVSIFEFLKPGQLPITGITPRVAKARIAPHFLRRRKRDVLDDLPEKQAFDRWLDLEDAQRAAYEEAERSGIVFLRELGATVTVQHVLGLLLKLKQLCNRDPRSGESCKLDYLHAQLEKLPEDCKALVFTQFIGEGLSFIAEAFEYLKPAIVHGQVSGGSRDAEVMRFQQDDSCRLFIATPKSGGIGLNLVRGNYVFHFDHWWNPATVRQAEDRAHRIGQTRDVMVFHLWIAGTVEERIHGILEAKRKLYADVIDELSNVEMSGLSETELFSLFGLRAPRKEGMAPEPVGRRGLLHSLVAMEPGDFERLVARVYEELGYGTRVTGGSHDSGVDVEASRTTTATGREMLAIQCKCYSPSNSVGRPECQKLLGVLSTNRQYNKAIIVTTSDFTSEARALVANDGRIQLIDGETLLKLIAETGLELQTAES